MKSFSACWSEALHAALKEACVEPYTMTLVGEDREALAEAVNQGIDSRLEACYVSDRGDSFTWGAARLECKVSPESLPVLVRRLLEGDGIQERLQDAAMSLASNICETLEIELV